MKIPEHEIIVDGECIGSYNTIQEISEKTIESLGKGAKQIYIEEVVNDD